MTRYSKEDIIRLVEENEIDFIRLQFTDIFGILKNIAIPKYQLKKALDNEMMFDGSSIDGFAVPMSKPLYTSRESAEITSPSTFLANSIA